MSWSWANCTTQEVNSGLCWDCQFFDPDRNIWDTCKKGEVTITKTQTTSTRSEPPECDDNKSPHGLKFIGGPKIEETKSNGDAVVYFNGVVHDAERIHFDFGDGNSNYGWFPQRHVYTENGTFTITISAYGTGNKKISTSKTITISSHKGEGVFEKITDVAKDVWENYPIISVPGIVPGLNKQIGLSGSDITGIETDRPTDEPSELDSVYYTGNDALKTQEAISEKITEEKGKLWDWWSGIDFGGIGDMFKGVGNWALIFLGLIAVIFIFKR